MPILLSSYKHFEEQYFQKKKKINTLHYYTILVKLFYLKDLRWFVQWYRLINFYWVARTRDLKTVEHILKQPHDLLRLHSKVSFEWFKATKLSSNIFYTIVVINFIGKNKKNGIYHYYKLGLGTPLTKQINYTNKYCKRGTIFCLNQ